MERERTNETGGNYLLHQHLNMPKQFFFDSLYNVHLFMVSIICLCTSTNVFHFFFDSIFFAFLCCSPIKTTHIKCFVMFLRFPSVNMKSASGKLYPPSHFVHIMWIYICGNERTRLSVDVECAVKSATFIFHKIVFYCVWFLAACC